jgi:hypothetical protein
VAPWEIAVVSLADPPAWLLLEAPRSTTPNSTTRKAATRIPRPKIELGLAPDLSRLPESLLELVRRGNGREYPSRSEADWAVCVEMFRAGYGLDEVWTVMTNPENGISEKFYEKGARGEDYLELTIRKAHAHWKSRHGGRGRTYAARKGRIAIDY